MSISQVTTNYGFRLIDFATDPYVDDEWFNWRLLDGLLSNVEQTTPFIVATGTGNAWIADYVPALTPSNGLTIALKTPAVNTGAVTLDVNGKGAHPVKINGNDVGAGALPAGMYVKLVYDGTNFNVVYPSFQLTGGARITTAASGVVPDDKAKDLVVESNADVGMTLATANSSKLATWYAGTPAKPNAGGLVYDFSVDRLYGRAAQSNGAYLDADGVWRQPKLPVFYYYQTGSQTPPTVNNAFKPNVMQVDQGPSAPHYDSATGEFTAPIAGLYEFDFDLFNTGQTNASVTWTFGFMVNGVRQGPIFTFTTTNASYNGHRGPFKVILSLAKNDKVKVNALSVSGETAAYSFTQYFAGKLLP